MALALTGALVIGACAPATPQATPASSPVATGDTAGRSITIYSGRSEELVGPLIERFRQETGMTVDVRYGDTAQLAALLLEEVGNTPADVYFAQDAGALGAVAGEGLLTELPAQLVDRVPPEFRSPSGEWVGISGRARVVVYDSRELSAEQLPSTIEGFTDPEWRGRIGWAPTNGSFQAFVTAFRVLRGDDAVREWLEGIQANDPRSFDGNTAIVQAVADGEIDVGFVNHYYLLRFLAEQGEQFPVRNHFLTGSDPGALVNVAGAGILEPSDNRPAAERFVEYLLMEENQAYFAEETYEYPLVEGVDPPAEAPPLEEIQVPDIDLSDLSDLQGTLELLRDAGALE
jgi:iron(III) transport system substrate-binding protein